MGEVTKIEWAHHTFNCWRGCTEDSPACDNCYARTMGGRNPAVLGVWGVNGTRPIAAESYWDGPRKWNAAAKQAGERKRVFCGSLMDFFEGKDTMPADAWERVLAARERVYDLVAATPYLDWLFLTKRPQNIMPFVPAAWRYMWPANAWIGATVENQEQADRRIPELLKVPTPVLFLSMEPLLGLVNLGRWVFSTSEPESKPMHYINWIITGGESGKSARPSHPDWFRAIRDQCVQAGVPFFFKQWGEYVGGVGTRSGHVHLQNEAYLCGDKNTQEWTEGHVSHRVGKRIAGRLLDEQEWSQVPTFQSQSIRLSTNDSKRFADALLNPGVPNDNLCAAFARQMLARCNPDD